jgi:hypothetical protein
VRPTAEEVKAAEDVLFRNTQAKRQEKEERAKAFLGKAFVYDEGIMLATGVRDGFLTGPAIVAPRTVDSCTQIWSSTSLFDIDSKFRKEIPIEEFWAEITKTAEFLLSLREIIEANKEI